MVNGLLEDKIDKTNFRIKMKNEFVNNNNELNKEKKRENQKNREVLKQANSRVNKELESNNNAKIREYANKIKLKRNELKKLDCKISITEKYAFIYNYYKKYIDNIKNDEDKLLFIDEQKLYAENNFGSFRGIGINNIISIEGALIIGIMATVIAEFIKLILKEIFLELIQREFLISEQWDFIIASGLVIALILRSMYKNSKIEKEDDIFNGLCIRALEKIEREISK